MAPAPIASVGFQSPLGLTAVRGTPLEGLGLDDHFAPPMSLKINSPDEDGLSVPVQRNKKSRKKNDKLHHLEIDRALRVHLQLTPNPAIIPIIRTMSQIWGLDNGMARILRAEITESPVSFTVTTILPEEETTPVTTITDIIETITTKANGITVVETATPKIVDLTSTQISSTSSTAQPPGTQTSSVTLRYPDTPAKSTPSSESANKSEREKNGLSAGAGAGITICVIVLLLAFCGVGFYLKQHCIKRSTSTRPEEQANREQYNTGPLGEGHRVLKKLHRRLTRLRRDQASSFSGSNSTTVPRQDDSPIQELSSIPSIQEMPLDGTSQMIARAKTSNMLGDLDCGSPSLDWDAAPVAPIPKEPIELPVVRRHGRLLSHHLRRSIN
ncbi:hypothetical protein QBC38DRAFT_504542 [Podospora fimiseda]|uniref:Uncharacterized protein n=1 Tax=Podospora fimiseda TaxID=252190 RepID=A0AAN6YNP1_9PEZI|nr:hypothetical protein QBC38DRAFT_504542 [Podospora fimiseda]